MKHRMGAHWMRDSELLMADELSALAYALALETYLRQRPFGQGAR